MEKRTVRDRMSEMTMKRVNGMIWVSECESNNRTVH